MIHEEKLNGTLNRLSSFRFRSPRPCTILDILPYPHLRRPAVSITYPFLPSTFRFIYRSFCLRIILRFAFSFPFCLPIRLSVHLFISFVCPSIRLSPTLFSRFFRDKSFYPFSYFLLLTTFLPFDIAFRRFIKIFSPVSQTANGIRINRTSVKEANLSSVVTQSLHFPFRLFAKLTRLTTFNAAVVVRLNCVSFDSTITNCV